MKAILAALVLAALGGALVWERNAITGLRKQNESLRAEKLEAERLAAENNGLRQAGLAAGAPSRETDHTELLRLRNEVRQLRGSQREAERLRAANQRLAEELGADKVASPRTPGR